MIEAQPLTSVRLVFHQHQIELRLRFGRDAGERILDRRRRLVFFAPGAVRAFVRWPADGFGTVLSRIDFRRACGAGEPCAPMPGVRPGGKIPPRLAGWNRVKRTLSVIDAVEQAGRDAADVAPSCWRHVHSRLLRGEPPRPYAHHQHCAWLLRRRGLAR
jgi:hypothetical protein